MKKTLYIFWLQGFNNAPFIVKKWLESWIKKIPTWDIVQLDKHSVGNYIDVDSIVPGLTSKTVTAASLSDIIRIGLIKKYGGLWVDATTYCTRPLDEWLEDYIEKGFFAFSFDRTSDRMIASWFLYGDKENYIKLDKHKLIC